MTFRCFVLSLVANCELENELSRNNRVESASEALRIFTFFLLIYKFPKNKKAHSRVLLTSNIDFYYCSKIYIFLDGYILAVQKYINFSVSTAFFSMAAAHTAGSPQLPLFVVLSYVVHFGTLRSESFHLITYNIEL